MEIKFEKQEVLDLNVLGTVGEILGQGGTIEFNALNFKNTNTKVFVDLVRPDGSRARAFCSPPMSTLVRSAEFGTTWQEKTDNLMSMEIIPTQRKEIIVDEETGQETTKVIDMLTIKSPVSVNKISVKASTTAKVWEPKPIDLGELVAL